MIVKLEGKYLVWSRIVDAPITFGMTREQLIAFTRAEDGRHGVEALERQLPRVDEIGTSSRLDSNADETMWNNRAGPKESRLHREEIIEFYVRRCKDPTVEELEEFRKGLAPCGPTCVGITDANGCSSWCRMCWGTGFVRIFS